MKNSKKLVTVILAVLLAVVFCSSALFLRIRF